MKPGFYENTSSEPTDLVKNPVSLGKSYLYKAVHISLNPSQYINRTIAQGNLKVMLHYFFLMLTIIDLIIPDPLPVLDELAFIYLTYLAWLNENKGDR